MLTKELFLKFINNYISLNVPVTEINEMLEIFLKSHLTDDGVALVEWYVVDSGTVISQLIEKDLFTERHYVTFKLESSEDLWNYMIKHKGEYFK